jgi:serine/threonine protein kinase
MALAPGTRLGPYAIIAPLGEGGMGQVWRARDTKLDRDVALEILPEAFVHDAGRVARFTREAKTLAALNHPHIAGIYALEESGGVTALVMELVEGEDLAPQRHAARLPPRVRGQQRPDGLRKPSLTGRSPRGKLRFGCAPSSSRGAAFPSTATRLCCTSVPSSGSSWPTM